jgi:hypothetical protein
MSFVHSSLLHRGQTRSRQEEIENSNSLPWSEFLLLNAAPVARHHDSCSPLL